MNSDELPKTLHEAITYFAQGDNALNFMSRLRWPDGKPKCPHCESTKCTFMKSRQKWQCKSCRKQFSVKVGTVMEDSPIKLDKWLCAIWLIANAKNGVSSYEIHRSLGVTQKTGWFLLHRIRLALHQGSFEKMSGTVEADETFIGGKARNMHADVKIRKGVKGGGASAMTPVQGLLERSVRDGQPSRVRLHVLKGTKKADVQKAIREEVEYCAVVHTDEWRGYRGIDDHVIHRVIEHAKEYVRGNVHTNGIENFWSLLKRTIRGTYTNCEPFHLWRYLDEQAFRFNERKENDLGRFLKAAVGTVAKRLTYAELTDADGRLRGMA